MHRPLAASLFALLVLTAGNAWSGDWINSGGNAGRNGLSEEIGPPSEDPLWSGGRTSLIAWLPVTEGNRLFTVRQSGWPGDPHDSVVVAMGSQAESALGEALEDEISEVRIVGDAKEPRRLLEAIYEGSLAGRLV